MAGETLLSTAVMGMVVVGVAMWVTLSPRWDRGRTQKRPARAVTERDDESVEDDRTSLARLTGNEDLWVLGFVVAVVATVVAVVGLGTETGAPAGAIAGLELSGAVVTFVAGFAAMLGAYLLYGIYYLAKNRGHPPSVAAAETVSVGGFLFVLAVLTQLVG